MNNKCTIIKYYSVKNKYFVECSIFGTIKTYGPFKNKEIAKKSARNNIKMAEGRERQRILDKATKEKHKKYPDHVWKKEYGFLYYIKIFHKNEIYYKIGYTSNENLNKRLLSMEIPTKFNVSILNFTKSSSVNAYDQEQSLHDKYKEKRANIKFLKSGNTEVYRSDVLKLDIFPKSVI